MILLSTYYPAVMAGVLFYMIIDQRSRQALFAAIVLIVACILWEPSLNRLFLHNSVLPIGVAPALAIFIIIMATFKTKSLRRPMHLMITLSALVWLIGHIALVSTEKLLVEDFINSLSAEQYNWVNVLEESQRERICIETNLDCRVSAHTGIGYDVNQEALMEVMEHPLQTMSWLMSLVWSAGLVIVVGFHRGRKYA